MRSKKISAGQLIVCHDEIAIVNACFAPDKIQVTFKGSKRVAIIGPEDIRYVISQQEEELPALEPGADLADFKKSQITEALRRYDILSKYLSDVQSKKIPVQELSRELGVGAPRVYQLVANFEKDAGLSPLIPKSRGRKRNSFRLPDNLELIIQAAIDDSKGPSSTITKIYGVVKRMCANAGLTPPSIKAVTTRVKRQNPKERSRNIYGSKKTRQDHNIRPHTYPVKTALELVQIDHCKVDCEVVDEKFRKAIARPWLTTAIDVYTRVVIGFYLSLDAPSALSNAMCMIHAVLPKKMWLEKYKLQEISYPFYGLPQRIHVDNGKDFRSTAFISGCAQYGIKLTWRPPGAPHNGAHVERFFGTLMTKVRALPGATLSSVADKKQFSNIPTPSMTMAELRGWITEQIGIYHHEEHSGLGCSPLVQWEESFTDRNGKLTTPELVVDSKHFFLSFLPFKRTSIQRSGVKVNSIDYFSPALTTFSLKTKCIARYNPMSLAHVWVKPEGENDYIECSYADVRHSDTSLAEFKQTKRELSARNSARINPDDVFEAISRNEQRVSNAIQLSKTARLRVEKKNHHRDALEPKSKTPRPVVVDYSQPPKLYDVE